MKELTESQVKEFEGILEGMKKHEGLLKELGTEGGWAAVKALPAELKAEQKRNDELKHEVNKLSKRAAVGVSNQGVRWINGVPFVSDEAARGLTATCIVECERAGMLGSMFRDGSQRQRMLEIAKGFLPGEEVRAPLDTTSTPVPTVYVPQVIELVWKYGQARQHGTVFPMGNGVVKLPRLAAGETAFAFLGVGYAGMSQTVGEKVVTATPVTFTANKLGGLIRIPTEIEEDTFIPLGQFLARYIARQFAQMEDKTMFIGDGTSTYANITGVGPYCTTNSTYLTQLASTKTKPSDAVIADFRNMRAQVNPQILNGSSGAYYMSATFDPLLRTFNTLNNPYVYVRLPDGSATLDGFPIYWENVSQAYTTGAAAAKYIAFFGDLSYWYLGERGAPRVEVSREVFFATDEIAMRALERIDVEAMAVDAMAALKTAAS